MSPHILQMLTTEKLAELRRRAQNQPRRLDRA
jgi:hypothetical protein